MAEFDIQAVLWFQDIREAAPDFVTDLFEFLSSDYVYLFLPVLILAYVLWFGDKRIGQAGGLTYSMAIATCYLLKDIIRCPRPWREDPSVHPHGHAGSYASPSGHATASVAGFGSSAVYFRGILRLSLIVLPILIMVSRIYLGMHTPSQLLFGAVLAIAFIAVNNLIVRWADHSDRNFTLSTMLYLMALFVLVLLAAEHTHNLHWKFALAASMGLGMVIGRHADHLYLGYSVPDIRPVMKAVLTVIGLIPLVPVLMLLPELFGKTVGYAMAGAFTGVWMFYLFPYVLSRHTGLSGRP